MSVHIEPVDQTVDALKSAEINCTLTGHPIDLVSWVKDGRRLAFDSRVTLVSPTRLVIREMKRQDQGMYQCFVSNRKEVVQGVAQLSLGGKEGRKEGRKEGNVLFNDAIN